MNYWKTSCFTNNLPRLVKRKYCVNACWCFFCDNISDLNMKQTTYFFFQNSSLNFHSQSLENCTEPGFYIKSLLSIWSSRCSAVDENRSVNMLFKNAACCCLKQKNRCGNCPLVWSPSFPVANAEASCGEQATSFLLPAVLCQLWNVVLFCSTSSRNTFAQQWPLGRNDRGECTVLMEVFPVGMAQSNWSI